MALPDFYPAAEWHPSPHCWPATYALDFEPGSPKIAKINHVMAGWISYLDQMAASPDGMDGGRRVSVHLGFTRMGKVHQYVKFNDHAWSNGLVDLPWPLKDQLGRRPDTGNTNGNIGTLTAECEGTGRPYKGITPYSPTHPWPEPMIEAILKFDEWSLKEGLVLPMSAGAPFVAGGNYADHGDLSSQKMGIDPGTEWQRSVRPRLVAALNGEPMFLEDAHAPSADAPTTAPPPVVLPPAPPAPDEALLKRVAQLEDEMAQVRGGILDLADTMRSADSE